MIVWDKYFFKKLRYRNAFNCLVYTTFLTSGKDYRCPCNDWFSPEVVHFYRSVAEAERYHRQDFQQHSGCTLLHSLSIVYTTDMFVHAKFGTTTFALFLPCFCYSGVI